MSVKISNISIVILAAGASSRMGFPKQLLKWGDDTLINHAIKTAMQTNVSDIIVVLGANYQLIAAEIKHLPITILNNKQWELGLGKSIAYASNYLENKKEKPEGLLITLADQPFITSEYLNALIINFPPNKKQIIASSYQKGKYGVPAIFDKYFFKQLSKLNDDFGAKFLLEKNEPFVKVLKPPVKNLDLDTLKEYKKFNSQSF